MDVRVRAALELGYPAHRIAIAMKRHSFRSAGALVEYLWDHIMEEEEEDVEMGAIPSAPPPPAVFDDDVSKLTRSVSGLKLKSSSDLANELLKETQHLHVMVHCLTCRLEKRNVLLLPCCHLSICSNCVKHVKSCPMKDCKQLIENTFVVYQA